MPGRVAVAAFLDVVEARILGREGGHLGPYIGPVCLVEHDEVAEIVVTRYLNEPVHEVFREIGSLAGVEVHGEEGDVGSDVATGQAVVELDAVEHHRRIAEEDVVEVEVTVALPDPPIHDAALQQVLALDVEPVRPVSDLLEAVARDELPDVTLGLHEVLVGVELDRFDRAELVDVRAASGLLVERH